MPGRPPTPSPTESPPVPADPPQDGPPQHTNRLAGETSPYLLQHAHNPVDWYPWGDEAFAKAEDEGKPVFLSIGYSACHWCHVMERESFEDERIAEYLNEHFVPIKVDREERPDVDAIYMRAVTALTGRGGWPMSVFLTPDREPFFGGTYWPPASRGGMPGFADVLHQLHAAWTDRRGDVDRAAENLTDAVETLGVAQHAPTALGTGVLAAATKQLLRAAEPGHGGFGRAPKFPHATDLRVLLRGWRRFGEPAALGHVTFTLEKMARGGMYDQLGGGFHRYSTDAKWLVPHFEKMLYDQALLVPAYLDAYQATGDDQFARVARETCDYVLREMQSPDGGLYSTQDADSEGEEGKFFVWTPVEFRDALGDDADAVAAFFDVMPGGNWEGHSILHRPRTAAEVAGGLGVGEAELLAAVDRAVPKLLAARERRVKPGRDEKVIAAWNGLMIAALARTAFVLDEPRFADAASRAAAFLKRELWSAGGGADAGAGGELRHSFKDGRTGSAGFLDDYAALADGLAELFQVTADAEHLTFALELAGQIRARFADPAGGFFYTPDGGEGLIVRPKDSEDGATPSGNALAATAFLKLGLLTGDAGLEETAVATLDALSGQIAAVPMASGQSLLALDFVLGPAREVVLAGGEGADVAPLRDALRTLFAPLTVHLPADAPSPPVAESLLAGKGPVGGRAAAYVCEKGTCLAPVTEPAALGATLSP